MQIAIDMDGVLCDFIGSANKKIKELFDIDIKYEEVCGYSYADTLKKKGVDIPAQEFYQKLMQPGLFRELAPMPGAIEALKELAAEGHEIVILTKILVLDRNSQGKRICSDHGVSEKLDWLAENLGDMPYSVIMVSGMKDKHLVNTHVIVDDDERALEHPTAITICMAHPWNAEYRRKLKGMQTTIFHMSELPEKIKFVEKVLRTRDGLEESVFTQMEEEVGIHESTAIESGSCECSD
jgi:5'(3')-deoxyribonucleotidase